MGVRSPARATFGWRWAARLRAGWAGAPFGERRMEAGQSSSMRTLRGAEARRQSAAQRSNERSATPPSGGGASRWRASSRRGTRSSPLRGARQADGARSHPEKPRRETSPCARETERERRRSPRGANPWRAGVLVQAKATAKAGPGIKLRRGRSRRRRSGPREAGESLEGEPNPMSVVPGNRDGDGLRSKPPRS